LIVVLDHGRVVEQGTHESLMFAGGLYRQLWEVQVGRRRRRVAADRMHGADALITELEHVANGNGGYREGAARLLLTALRPLVEEGDDDAVRALAARHGDRSGQIALAAELAERLLGELSLREAGA
jgi:hypothetical protein